MALTFLFALLFSIALAPIIINFFKQKQFGQEIREEGPKSHQLKSGTPTIGGLIFLIPTFILMFVFLEFNYNFFILFLLVFGFALIGFIDDFLKVYKKHNLGLTAKQKIIAQFLLSLIVYVLLILNGFDTSLTVPIFNWSFELGHFYFLFFVFFAIGTSNATNLTDGLDGLLSGTSIFAILSFTMIAYLSGFNDVALFGVILTGSILGFLLFNFNPAKVFMGDTGSLAIGGALVGIAVLTKTEILLALIGLVFVIETLSVIIQVFSFKTRKKRVFKMTPIHHHFELCGWSEKKVVFVFWAIGALLAILTPTIFFTFT